MRRENIQNKEVIYNGKQSFKDNYSITSVIIGKSVVRIEKEAFSNCCNLEEIEFSKNLVTIKESAFKNCNNLRKITIPSTVMAIYKSAFQNCRNLKKIEIPNSVINISEGAFGGCSNLCIYCNEGSYAEQYAIKNSIDYKYIDLHKIQDKNVFYNGKQNFSNNQNIKKAVIRKTVLIKENTFLNCTSLESINLPNDLMYIKESAFNGCTELKEIILPPSVIEIDNKAFKKCTKLKKIELYNTSINSIEESSFESCISLENIKIPNSVIYIKDRAFFDCRNLKEIEIPDSTKYIGEDAFIYCLKLKKIKIPNSVVHISRTAFIGCSKLCIYCNEGSYAEQYAIENNINYEFIKNINIQNNIVKNKNYIYKSKASKQKNEEVIYDKMQNFNNNQNIKKVIISDGIDLIEEKAFFNCLNLKEVKFSEAVNMIKKGAFQNCDSLKKIEIPNSITKIEQDAFRHCTNLYEIYIPKSVIEIGTSVFRECLKLEKIKLSNSITKIDEYTFHSCKALKKIEIPDSVMKIGTSAFRKCSNLEEIKLPESIIEIDSLAFHSCKALKKIEIPDSVIKVGTSAFRKCNSLEEVKIPNSVKYIGEFTFYDCPNICIYCNEGSYAEQYAIDHKISYKYIHSLEEIDGILEKIEESDTNREFILDSKQNIEIEEEIDLSNFENQRHIYLEHEIIKQIKDRKLEKDLDKLIVKINKDLSLNSLGFKKYSGIQGNIYGIDFSNSQNNGDRIIACFLNSYSKKSEFNFERYDTIQNENDSLILFCISEHDKQNEYAKKISDRISNNFYHEDDFNNYNLTTNNKTNNMTFNFVDFSNGKFIYEEVLTKDQSKNLDTFIMKSNPFILQGIAGSGKTLSTLNLLPDIKHKLDINGEISGKILYVTFSNSLKKYVQDIVEQRYSNYNSFLEIKTFDELCIDIYYKYKSKDITSNKIITQNIAKNGFDSFLKWILEDTKDKHLKDFLNNTSKELIYGEIFGILKGSMYINWDRTELNIVEKDFYLNDQKIIGDYKAFHDKEREYIYLITEKYNQWLEDNEKYDINDLSFNLFDVIKENSIGYEYVIVDEVQDFTEVQIYMLFLLAKEYHLNIKSNTKRIFLAGDPNQVINPTFFKVGRLKTLFYINGYDCNNQILHENFRNSHKIMDINNIVNGIINDKLPARKLEEQQKEILKNNKSGIVELVQFSESNLKIIMEGIKNSPKIALIVSDEDKKNEIMDKFNCDNIFTITEIKGREFDNIIIYNVLSDNADIYEEVYSKDKVNEGHYSYYFNRFYVSITRANYNLVLIEEKETKLLKEIKSKLGEKLDYVYNIKTFDDLNLGEINGTSLDLLNIGMNFLYDENFEKARFYLSRSMEDEAKDYLKACNLILSHENPDDSKKASVFLDLKKYKLAQIYLNKIHNYKLAAILYLYRNDLPNKNELFINYIKNNNLDLNDLCKDHLSTSFRLMEFLKEEEIVYDELDISILKKVSKSGGLKATKKLSEIYLEKGELELSLLYQMKLVDSEYGENYKEKIKKMIQQDYIEEEFYYQTQLGVELYLGRFIEKDIEKSLEVLKIADENGSNIAHSYLSLIQNKNEDLIKENQYLQNELNQKNEILKSTLSLIGFKNPTGNETLSEIADVINKYNNN